MAAISGMVMAMFAGGLTSVRAQVTRVGSDARLGTAAAAISRTGVGSSSAATTLNFHVGAGTGIASVRIVTQGVEGLDFQAAVAGATGCRAGVYGAETVCTVNVLMTPAYPGQRLGAVVITPKSGPVTTIYLSGAGVGPELAVFTGAQSVVGGSVSRPQGVSVDAAGNLYLANTGGNTVLKVPAGGSTQLLVAGGTAEPGGVAVDGAGNVFSTDSANGRVIESVWDGSVFGAPITVLSGLSKPVAVTVDGSGSLYIADAGANTVVKLPWAGTAFGTAATIGKGFNAPSGVTVDADFNVYVADAGNDRVVLLPASGAAQTSVGSGFSHPAGVAVDANSNVYVADFGNNRAVLVPWTGSTYGTQTTLTAAGKNGLAGPTGVAVDGAGNVYIADTANDRVVMLSNSPEAYQFPTKTSVGSSDTTDGAKSFLLRNIGNAALTISTPSAGLNPSVSKGFAYSPSSTCPQLSAVSSPATLAQGASCTYDVEFIPAVSGTNNGTLELTHNSLNTSDAKTIFQFGGASPDLSSASTAAVSAITAPYGSKTGITVTATEAGTAGAATGDVVTFTVTAPATGTFSPTTCVLLTTGMCTTTFTPTGTLAVGTYSTITASFGAGLIYSAATGTTTETITPIAPTVATVSAVTTTYGSVTAVTVTATESGSGGVVTGGVVTFGLAGSAAGSGTFSAPTCTLVAAGTCTVTYTPTGTLAAGVYTGDVTAAFGAVGNYAAASAVSTLTVSPAAQVVTFTATPASPATYSPTPIVVTLAATASGASGNPVVFSITAGAAFGTLSGTNNSTLTVTGAGTITIAANQAASSNYAAATQVTSNFVVNPAPQVITFAPAAVTYGGGPVTLTATGGLSGNPVTLALVSGPATLVGNVLTATGPGVIVVTANQAASANYAAATQVTATFSSLKAASAVSLGSTTSALFLGSSVTFTSVVSASGVTPAAGDSVTFYDGTVALATVTLNGSGSASYSSSSLALGSHVITAYFGGDTNLLPLTSAPVTVVVEDFSLTLASTAGNSGNVTVPPGSAVTYSFLLGMTNGANFPAGVSLSYTGGPSGEIITLTPTAVATGSAATAVTLTVQTPAQTGSLQHESRPFGLAPVVLALLILPFWGRLRRKAGRLSRVISVALLLLVSAGAVASLTGCGAGTGFFSQGPRSYTIYVTGTSATLTHTTGVTLTVE